MKINEFTTSKRKTTGLLAVMYLAMMSLYIQAQVPLKHTSSSENSINSSKAEHLLDTALEPLSKAENGIAIYFNKVALGISSPMQLNAMSKNETYEGGYFIANRNRFEYKLADLSAISDGNLIVIIDQPHKLMVVDSVRNKSPLDDSPLDLNAILQENLGEQDLTYMGEEVVEGKKCHKLQLSFQKKKQHTIFYWIELATGKLSLIAEKEADNYNLFWIDKIVPAAKNHKFEVFLPKREVNSFYGFQVQDLRFVSASRHTN